MEAEANRGAYNKRAYATKKHSATRLHYDLRLEWNGVLLSWALPKGPDCHAGVIRHAIEMEDHKKAYLQFEGVHETGPIMLWDLGAWEPYPESDDIECGLHRGILRFTLYGEKLKGGWTLTKTSATQNGCSVWTLCKHADVFAENYAYKCVLEERPNSISTGRTMEEIVQDWTRRRNNHPQQMTFFET